MSFDIYGERLRSGHCEVHPHVHEEYPCSICLADSASRRDQRGPDVCSGDPSFCQSAHLLGQAQGEINRLRAEHGELLEALQTMMALEKQPGESWNESFERIGEMFFRDTGLLRPGKDCSPHAESNHQDRYNAYEKWLRGKREFAFAAIAKATGETP